MLATVVHLTQRRFGLYHAHVFMYNEDTEELQIEACGYQEGDEHEGTHGTTTIPIAQEQSLVARAARTRKAIIVNDVRNALHFNFCISLLGVNAKSDAAPAVLFKRMQFERMQRGRTSARVDLRLD